MAATTTAPARSTRQLETLWMGPGGQWSKLAPNVVRRAYRNPVDEQGWVAWCAYLASRPQPPTGTRLTGKNSPLTWAVSNRDELDRVVATVGLLSRPVRLPRGEASPIWHAADTWLARDTRAACDEAFALECLAWCEALPRLAPHLAESSWWAILNRLVASAGRQRGSTDDPLTAQLLDGELALSLAAAFGELEDCRTLAADGAGTLELTLTEAIDADGVPCARSLHVLGPLLASWTRSRATISRLAKHGGRDTGSDRYAAVVRHALQLVRPDGRPVLAAPGALRWDPRLLATALRLADNPATRRAARLLARSQKHIPRVRHKKASTTSFHSEPAGLGVLRCDWPPSSPQLTVAYGSPPLKIDLTCGGDCLWSGPWDFEVYSNGRPLARRSDWEHVCWESNADVDYLELEIRLENEVTIQRHMLLARQDRFLLLADAVLGIGQSSLAYRGVLPLAGWTTFRGEADTREGTILAGRRPRARVLPLALPEWRAARAGGELQAGATGLELSQSIDGECLLAGLFVDLEPRRTGKPLTWRQLTVAEDRQIVAADVAVGYRVQVGKSQWLVYRSLAPPGIRTVLSKNLMHEFFVGRFQPDGRVEMLLEIEA